MSILNNIELVVFVSGYVRVAIFDENVSQRRLRNVANLEALMIIKRIGQE
jgi:hypothetical protein